MSDDVVHCTGRQMTGALQRALDDLTGADRRAVTQALGESTSETLGALHHAIALELQLAELRDQEAFRLWSREHLEAMTEPPMPAPPEGVAWTFDPDGDTA